MQKLGAELVLEDAGFSSKISAATDKVKIFEKVTNQGGKAVDGVSKKMSSGVSTIRNYIGAYIGIRSIVGIYKDWTAASKDASTQETKLRAIMANTKGNTDAGAQAILDYSNVIQSKGVVEGDTLISGAQMAATFQLNEKTIRNLMPAMGDLIAQQKGLNSTTEDGKTIGLLLGKAMTGQSAALKRVGINFNDSQEKVLKYGTEQQKLATILQVVKMNVGGVNAAMAETPEGKIKQTQNQWQDLTETMGAKFLSATAPVAAFLSGKLPQIQEALGTSIDFVISTGSALVAFFSAELWPRLKQLGSGLYNIYTTYLPNAGEGFSLLGSIVSTTLTTSLDIINAVVGAVVEYKDIIQIAGVGLISYRLAQEAHVLWTQRQVMWTTILDAKTKILGTRMIGAYGVIGILAMGAYSLVQVYQESADVTTEWGQDMAVLTSSWENFYLVLQKVANFVDYTYGKLFKMLGLFDEGQYKILEQIQLKQGADIVAKIEEAGRKDKIGRYDPDFIKKQQEEAKKQMLDGEADIKKAMSRLNMDMGAIDMNVNAPDKNAKDKVKIIGGATKFSSAFNMDGSTPSDYSISGKSISGAKSEAQYSKAQTVSVGSGGGVSQNNTFNFYDVGKKSVDELLSEFVPQFKKVCQNM